MCEHLLSPLHIQKLGHPIEEIRIRALSSVISKYNLNLVDETNLENTKLLLEKLLDWFNFDKHSEEEKVLNLILKILRYDNADLILREIGINDILKKINEIEKKIGYVYSSLIQNMKEHVRRVGDSVDKSSHLNFLNAVSEKLELLNGNIKHSYNGVMKDSEYMSAPLERLKRIEHELDFCEEFPQTKDKKLGVEVRREQDENCIDSKSVFKVEYFPWQHLVPGDKHVLSSVYDGLRYIDNKNSILQSCQFFNEVILRDFPTEIFLQRPLVLRTLLALIESTEQDVRIPVLKCLTRTIHCLKRSIQFALNVSVFHLKEEFYSTFVFGDTTPSNEDVSSQHSGLPEHLHLNLASFDEDLQFNVENDACVQNLKKFQVSLPECCFEIVFKVLPQLGKSLSQEEVNFLIVLSFETLNCIILNIKSDIWNNQIDLKDKFSKVFGMLNDLLKYHKGRNQIIYIILLYICIKLLNSLKPPTGIELSAIMPRGLHVELGSCLTDFVLVLMFPQLHSQILKYVEQLFGQREKETVQDYRDMLLIMESMKSSVKFLKCCGKSMSKLDKLECLENAFLSLDFHQNFNLIHSFITCCLLKWSKSQLKDKELKIREKILIRLLSHSNNFVKVYIYKVVHEYAVKLLGVDEAVNPKYEFPGDKMEFLFQVDILTEIICHGLDSPIVEVRKYSSEILIHLLRSKFIMSDTCWTDFMSALIPCSSLLQCFADKSTTLGRCIVKMFDPDVAKSTGLPLIELLKGNVRFLFSKINLIREEAMSRLFWLLSKEDYDGKKLPRMSVLMDLNLSGICSAVTPQEYTKVQRSFYSPGRLCDVMEMLCADNVEPNIRRSALSQISVMMDDVHLHSTFLEQNGLDKILQILDNCLIEREYRNYPDSVKPIVDILKLVCLHNVCVRQELSFRIDVFYNVLRSLLLFNGDETLRQNAVELLCLLLYNDCILRVPPDKSIKCTISFPEVVVTKMSLPFLTHIHWRNSRHLEPSMKKSLMSKESCSKLLRAFWAIQWIGKLSDALAMEPSDLKDKAYSPGIPDDFKVSYDDLELLRSCAFDLSVKQTLYNIQNGTSHEAVLFCLHELQSYFLLYDIEKSTVEKSSKDIRVETLPHGIWESTLQRFMTSVPSCLQDESLLLQVIRFLQQLLRSFKIECLIDWVGKLLIDNQMSLFRILRNMGSENFGLKGRELRLAIIELTQQIVTSKSTLDTTKWFPYLELVSDNLKLDNREEFYNVAYIDWLLSLLVDLMGKWSWSFAGKTDFLENLIIRIMEIIIAFHCTKDSAVSFMGMNIVKNSLFVLNHILSDVQAEVKGWEELWFRSLTKVIGHMGDVNYCWLLSLWFMRDSIVRASSFQLFVGFSTTCQACELLIDKLNIQVEEIWTHGFKVLFDENECSFVREKSALLLSNLARHGPKVSFENVLQHLQSINFYEETFRIVSNFRCESSLSEVVLHQSNNTFEGQVVTTPSFVTSICVLLESIISLNPSEVSEKILEIGLLEGLTMTIGDIPESTYICQKHQDCVDVIRMYIAVSRLVTRCLVSSWSAHSFMLQSQFCVNYLFAMINYNSFCEESKTITALKSELWTEILNLFSVLLTDNPEWNQNNNNNQENNGFAALNRAMTENGIDHFISSIYIALTSDVADLRSAVLNFFINFFRHEMDSEKSVTVSDIFERKICPKALNLALHYGWKRFTISESLSPDFGIRIADILSQIFVVSGGCPTQICKTVVADALGSLLAVFKPAQNFCLDQGLVDSLVSCLKHICVKLNLESVDNLKKLSYKKKIAPFLSELETLFRLASNLMFGNEETKMALSNSALAAVVHKLWPWCATKQSLLIVTLKMLCNFTRFCEQGCRTLILSANSIAFGLKKSPGSITLMNSIANQLIMEMDTLSNSQDCQILRLCLQLMSNCCGVTECRSVISKGSFLDCFTKLHPNRKKPLQCEGVVEAWLRFFIAFSSHQEGQLTLTKNQDILDLIMVLSTSSKFQHRVDALTILRNICFHQLNRVRMLSSCTFLSLLFETLECKRREEIQSAVIMIWTLTYNTQKAKVMLRSSGFDGKLEAAKKFCVLNEDEETADLIEVVLGVLRNK